jgi:hypothetical protein
MRKQIGGVTGKGRTGATPIGVRRPGARRG